MRRTGGVLVVSWFTHWTEKSQLTSSNSSLLSSLSDKSPWEKYEPPYPPCYGLNNTPTVLLEGWIWY